MPFLDSDGKPIPPGQLPQFQHVSSDLRTPWTDFLHFLDIAIPTAIIAVIVAVPCWLLWRYRTQLFDKMISGLAVSERARRRTVAAAGELKQQINDRIEQQETAATQPAPAAPPALRPPPREWRRDSVPEDVRRRGYEALND